MKWFKFYGQDWLTDMKIRQMSTEDKLCYITLLCLASAAGEGGLIRNCDEEQVIVLTALRNEEIERARGCLMRYEALHCVTLHDNGDVTVINFDARQNENLSNAERQHKYRERLKIKTEERNDSNVTQRNDSNARIDKNRIDKNNIYTQSFELFWNAYPKKVGKAVAEKSWLKLKPSPELVEQIVKDVSNRASSEAWSKEGRKYCPNPSTYLNQRRWEDEIEEEKVLVIKK